jgi:hypothetical protein
MGDYQYVTTNECCASNGAARPAPQRTEGVRIKCRTYGAVTIPADTEAGTVFPLVNLNVDTKGYRKVCVKLEFLSNILTDTATATLNFQLFRQCNGQLTPVPASAVWTFSRAVATADEANSFGFALCDCDNCGCECCNYSVAATVAGAATTGTVTVNNATLIATVVEGEDC